MLRLLALCSAVSAWAPNPPRSAMAPISGATAALDANKCCSKHRAKADGKGAKRWSDSARCATRTCR